MLFSARTLRLVLAWVCFGAACLRAQDQTPLIWRERTDVGSPGLLDGAAMAFDAARGVTLLFGGQKSAAGVSLGLSDELWQYDGASWRAVTVTGVRPAARVGHAMVYDPVGGRVLLFGGDAGGGVFLNDLWAFVFSGPAQGSWQRLTDLPAAGRRSAAMGYDPGRSRIVVVGGFRQGEPAQTTPSGLATVVPATRETWEWDRSTWRAGPASPIYNNGPYSTTTERVTGGPFNGTLGYHPTKGKLLLFAERAWPANGTPPGGSYLSGDWPDYDGTTWAPNTSGYVAISTLPIPATFFLKTESRFQSAYDPVRARLVVVPGGSALSYEYSGTRIAEPYGNDPLNPYPSGFGTSGNLPARSEFCLAHDTVRGVTVFFGGKASATAPGDTWELVENPALPFAVTNDLNPASLEPCAGDAITLTAAATGFPPLRFQWRRDGNALSGKTASTLTLTNVTPADNGRYTFEVTDPSGRTLTSAATTVFVHTPPAFTSPPTPRRVVPGETFSLEARWTSTLPVSIQWRKDGVDIPGATAAIYTKTGAAVTDSGFYTVALTTRCTTVVSAPGRVFVGPVINVQPTAAPGASVGSSPVGFTVTADGVGALTGAYTTGGDATEYPDRTAPDSPTHPRPLVFTWRREGVPITPGPKYTFIETALTSNLVINAPDYEDEGYYDCVVADISGPAYAKTTTRTLLVLEPLSPPYLTIPGPTPDPRIEAAMVYDSKRGRTVLFGGTAYGYNPRTTSNSKTNYASDDTWEWDGKVWVLRHPAHRPPALTGFGMTYDWRRGRVVIFGGYEYQPPAYAAGTQVLSNKVWEWDGNDWSQIVPTTPSPPARNEMSLCYDSAAGEVLMIGGNAFSPAQSNQHAAVNALWAWDGAAWSQRTTLPILGFNAAPYMYPGNAFVYDEARGVAVLFGPFFDSTNPVWEWDGATWRKITPPATLRLTDSRYGGAAFYDSVRRRVAVPILSNNLSPGTATPVSTVVYWDGSQFTRGDTSLINDLTGTVNASYGSAPVFPGEGDLTAFDSARRALVWLDNEPFYYQGPSTTREMHFSAKVKPVHVPVEVVFFPNETLRLRAIAAGQRGLVYQWFKDGAPLLDDGRITGADKPVLTITATTAADAGRYRARVTNVYNQVFTAEIVVGRQTQGVAVTRSADTLTLYWPGTTGILETTTNLTGPWTRLPGATSPFNGAIDEPGRFYRVVYP